MKKLIFLAMALSLSLAQVNAAGLTRSDVPNLSGGIITGTAASGAVTANGQLLVITTEALTTAAAADYTLTITDNRVDAGATAFVSVGNGTNTTVPYFAHSVAVSAGSVVIKVRNAHASAALNGTLVIYVLVL